MSQSLTKTFPRNGTHPPPRAFYSGPQGGEVEGSCQKFLDHIQANMLAQQHIPAHPCDEGEAGPREMEAESGEVGGEPNRDSAGPGIVMVLSGSSGLRAWEKPSFSFKI